MVKTPSQVTRPDGFPKAGDADEIHLKSLLEGASPEERDALQSLFIDGIGKVLAKKARAASALTDPSSISSNEAGESYGYGRGSEIAKQYGNYLATLITEAE